MQAYQSTAAYQKALRIPPQRATANYRGILVGTILAVVSLLWWSTRQSRQARTAPQPLPSTPPTSPDPSPHP
jgi:hypothetical protein